jgi:hypothetical protein
MKTAHSSIIASVGLLQTLDQIGWNRDIRSPNGPARQGGIAGNAHRLLQQASEGFPN